MKAGSGLLLLLWVFMLLCSFAHIHHTSPSRFTHYKAHCSACDIVAQLTKTLFSTSGIVALAVDVPSFAVVYSFVSASPEGLLYAYTPDRGPPGIIVS